MVMAKHITKAHMTDYIRREDALKALYNDYAYSAMDVIKRLPAADVAEVVHGKWASEAKGGVYGPVCSVCGYYIPGISFWNAPYCPKCGARMDGGNDNVSD